MPLHPEVIQFLETQRSLELKPIEQCTPDEFRKVMRLAIPANGEAEPMEAVVDREIFGNVGPSPLRNYRPQGRKTRIHGDWRRGQPERSLDAASIETGVASCDG